MTERPKRDLEKEREELLRVLDSNAAKEVKEAIQIALSALPKPTPPTISYSTKGFRLMPTRNEIAIQVIQAKETAQDEIRRTFFRKFHECTSRDAILYASAFSSRKGIEMPGLFLSIVLEDMQGFYVRPSRTGRQGT